MKKKYILPAIDVVALAATNILCTSCSYDLHDEEVVDQWAPERQVPTEFELIY